MFAQQDVSAPFLAQIASLESSHNFAKIDWNYQVETLLERCSNSGRDRDLAWKEKVLLATSLADIKTKLKDIEDKNVVVEQERKNNMEVPLYILQFRMKR